MGSARGLTCAGAGENVSPSRPGDRKVGGLRHFLGSCYRSMPSLRSSTIAARRQRIVSGENGSVNGIPFALRSGFAVAQDVVVAWRRLDREAHGSRRRMNSRTSFLIRIVSLVFRCGYRRFGGRRMGNTPALDCRRRPKEDTWLICSTRKL